MRPLDTKTLGLWSSPNPKSANPGPRLGPSLHTPSLLPPSDLISYFRPFGSDPERNFLMLSRLRRLPGAKTIWSEKPRRPARRAGTKNRREAGSKNDSSHSRPGLCLNLEAGLSQLGLESGPSPSIRGFGTRARLSLRSRSSSTKIATGCWTSAPPDTKMFTCRGAMQAQPPQLSNEEYQSVHIRRPTQTGPGIRPYRRYIADIHRGFRRRPSPCGGEAPAGGATESGALGGCGNWQCIHDVQLLVLPLDLVAPDGDMMS